MNKRGDVAVTIFCALSIALLGFALFYFVFEKNQAMKGFYGIGSVRENNIKFEMLNSELNGAMEKAAVKTYYETVKNSDNHYGVDDAGNIVVKSDEELNKEFVESFEKNLNDEMKKLSFYGEGSGYIGELRAAMFDDAWNSLEDKEILSLSFEGNKVIRLKFDNSEAKARLTIRTRLEKKIKDEKGKEAEREIVSVSYTPEKITGEIDLDEIGLSKLSFQGFEDVKKECKMGLLGEGGEKCYYDYLSKEFANFDVKIDTQYEIEIKMVSKRGFDIDGKTMSVSFPHMFR